MTTPNSLFRKEAILKIEGAITSITLDSRVQRNSLLVPSLIIMLLFSLSAMFIQVSLGTSATGILRLADAKPPIVAERNGLLVDVISERIPLFVDKDTVIAKIRNFDLVTLRRAPNTDVSIYELERKKIRIEERLLQIRRAYKNKLDQNDNIGNSLTRLRKRTADLIPIYQNQVVKLRNEIDKKQNLFKKNFISEEAMEDVKDVLAEAVLKLRETEIRVIDIDRNLHQNKLSRVELAEEHEKELLALENNLADTDLAIKGEAELESSDVKMNQSGLLIPRGFLSGQTVEAGDILFDVAPTSGQYLFEVDVQASQIGELKEGALAKISVTAFPYFEHGFIDGSVEHISTIPNQAITLSDNLPTEPKFRLIIKPEPISFNKYKADKTLTSGMGIEVHIRKEKVALWRVLLSPLLRFQARLF